MLTPQAVANPFALMMDPQAVLKAMEASERLETLQRRICRPLDKPLIPKDGTADSAADEEAADMDDFGA